jgi:hypothetical protein
MLPGTPCTVSLKYDPFGRRIYISSSSGISIYAYDGQNLIEEANSSGVAVARYTQGEYVGEPLAMLRSSHDGLLRHTFRTLLDETGALMKVQQELMRYADIGTTMNVYRKAMDESERAAHGKVVRLALPSQVA